MNHCVTRSKDSCLHMEDLLKFPIPQLVSTIIYIFHYKTKVTNNANTCNYDVAYQASNRGGQIMIVEKAFILS